MKQRCPDCASLKVPSGNGNGKCSKCYGGGKVGTIADDIAGGKRACPQCRGTGQCQTCAGDGVISVADKPRPHANAELNPLDDKVAVRTVCPTCGAIDWFEWKFLGKLRDPVCGHSWYADSGMYTLRQISAISEMARRMIKYLNHDVSGEGAWIGKLFGGFLGVVFGMAFRLPFALIMIPIQAIVRSSSQKTSSSTNSLEQNDNPKARGQSA